MTKAISEIHAQFTETLLTDCQYVDDDALLPTTRSGAIRAVTEYMKTSQDFGLSLGIP